MSDRQLSDESYNQGFKDGISYVANCIRRAADQLDELKRTIMTKDGKSYNVIQTIGQRHYASRLRDLAQTLERITQQ